MNGYVGSASVDRDGRIVAAASPRGGAVEFWDVDSGEPIGAYELKDICGVSATRDAGGFIVTSGRGDITVLAVKRTSEVVSQGRADMMIDYHCHLA